MGLRGGAGGGWGYMEGQEGDGVMRRGRRETGLHGGTGGNVGGAAQVHYLDCGDGFISIHVSKLVKLHALNVCFFHISITSVFKILDDDDYKMARQGRPKSLIDKSNENTGKNDQNQVFQTSGN